MRDEIERLKTEWNRAWFAKDADTVERLTTEDYVYVAPNGKILDRGVILGIIRSPGYRLLSGSRSELRIRMLGETAALAADRWQGEGVFEGRGFKEDHRCVGVCVREGNQWRFAFEQCAAITPPDH